MRTSKKLKGRRIAVLAVDGFEKAELSIPVAAMRAAGASVKIISLHPGRIRGVNLHEPAGKVGVDFTLGEVSPEQFDGLFLPGGLLNPDLLRQSKEARELVRAFDESEKPIAAICHSPWMLVSAGLVAGRVVTSWPGIRDDLVNAGATWLDQEVVRDQNWLTSRGPQDMIPFVSALLDFFAGEAVEEATSLGSSDPQRNEPPAVVINAMKWIPRPSFRTTFGLGLLAVGIAAFYPRRAA
jgi:protease I